MTITLIQKKVKKYTSPKGASHWKHLYKCFCGSDFIASPGHIKTGHTKSCGCKYEYHGLRGTSEYTIWSLIKDRCNNVNTPAYFKYGGRGITVCEAWNDSFMAFYNDMGPRPSSSHSIERIDNNLGYTIENCKWATDTEQANNRRTNKMLTLDGQTKTLAEWAKQYKIAQSTLSARIRIYGWTVEEAITTPIRKAS